MYRGPQGTFAGANSTGGAVFVTSNSPNLDKVGGTMEVWGGDYNDLGARGAVNMPLTDKLAVRVAVNIERRDSFYKIVGGGLTPTGITFNAPGKLDEKDARVSFLWEPTEDLSIFLKLAGGEKSTDGYAARPIPGTVGAPFAPADLRTLNYDTPERNDEQANRNMLEVKYVLPDGITLRSVSGYQSNLVKNVYDSDATANPAIASVEDQDVRERPFTQEINIISPTGNRLSWIGGFYYWYDRINVGLHLTNAGVPGGLAIDGTIITNKKSVAGFARVLYQLTDQLKVEVGGRYTEDTVNMAARPLLA